MMYIIAFIYCGQLTLSEYKKDILGENDADSYISIINCQDDKFRPYDELQKNMNENKNLLTGMESDDTQEIITVETNIQFFYNHLYIMKSLLINCENKINQFKMRMESKSTQEQVNREKIRKDIEFGEDKNIYEKLKTLNFDNLCIKTKKQLMEIKKLMKKYNTPIDIHNILIDFMKLIELFLTIYDMKNDITGFKYLCEQSIKLHRFDINIYSAFDYIPMIDTFEILRNRFGLYRYENKTMKRAVSAYIKALKMILFSLISSSYEARKIHEEIIQIYEHIK
ncbi:uncharacterized protein VNE69_02206 [Vairimorpha necatrix]|uniref:Uncharacterized protein n=1 Tax=Vairimorpha necatrix TaxID=6039 RepID=A0AAX4J9N2_9MICR